MRYVSPANAACIPAMRSAATTKGSMTHCWSPSRSAVRPRTSIGSWLRWRPMKLIFEKSQAGRRGGELPRYDLRAAKVPDELRRAACRRGCRSSPSRRSSGTSRELSTRNFGIDTGFYPLGSCTMKYNPRVNERLAMLPGFRDLHPYQDEDGVQGALE